MARGHRGLPGPAVDQPAPPARLGRAARARVGRPALPGVGGRAAVPRHLPRPGPAGRPRCPRPSHGGLGRGAAAVPPRHARPVRRRAAAGPERRRDQRPAPSRVPDPERAVRARRGPAAVPAGHVRARAAVGAALRWPARDVRERRAPRGALAAERVHGPGRGRRRRVPLPRGPAPAPGPDAGRGGGRGRGAGQARARRRRPRGRWGVARGAARLLPRRGLVRGPAPAGRAGRAARGGRAERVGGRGPARHRAPRPVGRARRGPPGAQRRPLVHGDRRLHPRRVRVRAVPCRRCSRAASASGWPHGSTRSRCPPPTRSARSAAGWFGSPCSGPGTRHASTTRPHPSRAACSTSRRARWSRRAACSRRPRTPARPVRSRVRPRGSVRRWRLDSRGRRGTPGRWIARSRTPSEPARRGSRGLAVRWPSGWHRARRTRGSSPRRRSTRTAGRIRGGSPCSTSPRRGPRPATRSAGWPRRRRRPGSSGASGPACSRRGRAAWARSVPRASGRPTAARPRSPRSRRVAARAPRRRACSRTRRWPTATIPGAGSTACSRTPSVPTRDSSFRGRPAWRRR